MSEDDIEEQDMSTDMVPETTDSKKTKRLRWTSYEEATLIKLAGKLSAEHIASIMGRTLQSVKMRANTLQISLKSKKAVWTQDRIDKLQRMKQNGESWKDIAKSLKCTEMSCMKIYQRTFGTRDTALKNEVLTKFEVILEKYVEDERLVKQILKECSDAI